MELKMIAPVDIRPKKKNNTGEYRTRAITDILTDAMNNDIEEKMEWNDGSKFLPSFTQQQAGVALAMFCLKSCPEFLHWLRASLKRDGLRAKGLNTYRSPKKFSSPRLHVIVYPCEERLTDWALLGPPIIDTPLHKRLHRINFCKALLANGYIPDDKDNADPDNSWNLTFRNNMELAAKRLDRKYFQGGTETVDAFRQAISSGLCGPIMPPPEFVAAQAVTHSLGLRQHEVSGHVYFAFSNSLKDDAIKIGRSKDLLERWKPFTTANVRMEVIYAINCGGKKTTKKDPARCLESNLHYILRNDIPDDRVGKEWFKRKPVMELIKKLTMDELGTWTGITERYPHLVKGV